MSQFEKHRMADPRIPVIFNEYIFQNRNTHNGGNWHENIEILCFTEGTGSVLSDGITLPVSAGDIVVVNTNSIHDIVASPFLRFYCLIVDRSFCLSNGVDTNCTQFSPLLRDEELFSLMMHFSDLFAQNDSTYRILKLRSVLLSILSLLCEKHSIIAEKPLEDSRLLASIKSVIAYIHAESHLPLTLDSLAQLAGMSKCYLSRTFHRITGYTVIEYINHTRCEKAKLLLAENALTVENIALSCGFANVSYFIRTFASITGMRPGEYRASLSKSKEK